MAKEKLYKLCVYGQLMPEYDPPKGFIAIRPITIHGELYDLGGNDAAAIKIGKTEDEFEGYLIAVPESELKHLDLYEMSDYKRVATRTVDGDACYIYEYSHKLPDDNDIRRVRKWVWGHPDFKPEEV